MCKVCHGSGVLIVEERPFYNKIEDDDVIIPAHLDLCSYCVQKHELEYQKALLERSFDVTSMDEQ